MTKIIIAMYNPETDCVEVSLDEQIHVSFDCQKCNVSHPRSTSKDFILSK